MAIEIRAILETFDLLPDTQKRELAAEIVRRTLQLDAQPLSDEQLISAADEVFLDLDRGASEHA